MTPHTQPRGFMPVQRTEKREGDKQYIYDFKSRQHVAVPVGARQ